MNLKLNSLHKMILILFVLVHTRFAHAIDIPECRLDFTLSRPVENAANRVIDMYNAMGISLPFNQAKVGKSNKDNLSIEIVKDATQDRVDSNGCLLLGENAINENNSLDKLSVKGGGCYVPQNNTRLVRCSSEAIWAFVHMKPNSIPSDSAAYQLLINEEPTASPALLYVLAHEIAHIHQGRTGEFTGEIKVIDLSELHEEKLKNLIKAYDPNDIRREQEADELALKLLSKELLKSPYKEKNLSSQGSLYWNIDKINLAADALTQVLGMEGGMPQPKIHSSFIPTEFPTPPETIKKNAYKFVCDILNNNHGIGAFPMRATTHPSPEHRLRRIVEVLKPIAERLPKDDGSNDLPAVANIQNDLSKIFSHIYEETGVYMEILHQEIATIINGELNMIDCSKLEM